MELRALRYFVTVADELHFGRAAERLHVAQPAVSQQVARLERELGVQLLDRSPRRVRLTAAGYRVLDAARDTLAAAERVRAAVTTAPGTVRIGTGAGLTSRLERGIDALRAHGSAFDVVLVDLPLPARLNALRRGEVDFALARGEFPAPGLTVTPTWTEPLVAIVSKDHDVAGRATVSLAELADSALRLPSPDHDLPLREAINAALRDASVRPRPGRPAGAVPDTIVEVGTDSRSWTVLPADQAAEIGSDRVRAIPLKPAVLITGSVIVPADGGRLGHAAACAAPAFRDALAV